MWPNGAVFFITIAQLNMFGYCFANTRPMKSLGLWCGTGKIIVRRRIIIDVVVYEKRQENPLSKV